jgi:hypothetical protein
MQLSAHRCDERQEPRLLRTRRELGEVDADLRRQLALRGIRQQQPPAGALSCRA